MTTPKNISKWVLMFATVVVITIIPMEIIARFLVAEPAHGFGPPESWANVDKVIGWAAKPGVFHATETGRAEITYWSNHRRATQENPIDKIDKPLIVTVGDSWTMGWGVKDDETFAYRLNQSNDKYIVENYGAGGYSTFQAYLMLKRILTKFERKPTVAILGYTQFMSERDGSYYQHMSSVRSVRDGFLPLPPLISRDKEGKITASPPSVTMKWPLEDDSALVNLLHNAYFKLYFDNISLDKDTDRHVTTSIIDLIVDLTKEHGVPLLVVTLADARDSFVAKHIRQKGVTNVYCYDPPGGDRPLLRVGGNPQHHPSAEFNVYFASCIQNKLTEMLAPN